MADREASAALPRDVSPLSGFLQTHRIKLVGISALLVVPCFWQRHIEAGDLASHLYNTWLVQLIHRGQAPGLWIAPMWNNVLFDWLLSGCVGVLGFAAGEKVAVAIAVLVFFWGSWAFAAAVAKETPWTVLPCLAMVAYGWTFHAGFFNYYLSVGLAFWGLAIFLWGKGGKRYLALALAPLILLAHPFGLAWFVGALVYLTLSEKLPPRFQVLLLLMAAALLEGVHVYLWKRFPAGGTQAPLYLYQGADQLALSTDRHLFVAGAALIFGSVCFIADLIERRSTPGLFRRAGVPLQVYAMTLLAAYLLPDAIQLGAYGGSLSLITPRLTLFSAVAGCGVLATVKTRHWHLAGFCVIAAGFFVLTFQQTAQLSRLEEQALQLVSKLPSRTRVMATIVPRPESRIYFVDHVVDRACIERCFAYANYEPASGQFRVRASPGNGIVLWRPEDVARVEIGRYTVQPEDVPAVQINQCFGDFARLCSFELRAGERNYHHVPPQGDSR